MGLEKERNRSEMKILELMQLYSRNVERGGISHSTAIVCHSDILCSLIIVQQRCILVFLVLTNDSLVFLRLPVIQGSSFAFIPPVLAMMSTKQWQCPQHLPDHNG